MAKKSIKGTKTEKNLAIAYMAESGAYSRYTYYAQQADKERGRGPQRAGTARNSPHKVASLQRSVYDSR